MYFYVVISVIVFLIVLWIWIWNLKRSISQLWDRIASFDAETLNKDRISVVNGALDEARSAIEDKLKELDKSRCPSCSGVCRPKSIHCSHCGKPFYTPPPPQARVTSHTIGYDYANLYWDCKVCGTNTSRSWSKNDIKFLGDVFICKFKCNKCSDCQGESLIRIDFERGEMTVSDVAPWGSLNLNKDLKNAD